MQYSLAFGYILNRTGGFANLLLLSVCYFFIPIVGPIVVLGYRSEISQALLKDPELRRHPKFDFNRFVEYLTRGVWPFLTGLVVGLAIVPFALLALFGGMIVGAGMNQPAIGMAIGFGVYGLLLLAVSLISAPMTFHSELAGKFDLGGAFRFTLDFWKTVPGPTIATGLIYIPLSIALTLAGLLVCFIGVYPASLLAEMAGQHLMVQLYALYLDRGGAPIREYEPPEEEDDWDDEYDDDDDYEEDRRRRRRRRR